MKHKVKQYILRAAPLILVCCIFVFALSPSASAEALNYRDYEKYVTVDGDNDLVTVSFPQEWFSGVFTNSFGAGLAWWSGWDFSFEPNSSVTPTCWAYIAPFGGPTANTSFSYTGLYLSLDNIPSDASWHISFKAWVDNEPNSVSVYSSQIRSFSVLDSHAAVYEYLDVSPIRDDENRYVWSVDGHFPSGPDGWFSQIIIGVNGIEDNPFSIHVTSFTVTLSISSLYRLQEQTGETNELLDEVNKQLAEQGKTMEEVLNQQNQTNEKLDDIINGEVAPEAPEGADKVGDLDDAEGQLRDEAQVGLDQGVEIQQSVLQILEEYANGFAVFSWIFGLFAKLPFFSGLLYVSVALGTVSALLNLGLSAQSASHRSQRRKKGG